MPPNTRAYPHQRTGHLRTSRHRVDRIDDLGQRVPSARRWVTLELQHVAPTRVDAVLECGRESVRFEIGTGLSADAPGWAVRVLDYLGIDEKGEE